MTVKRLKEILDELMTIDIGDFEVIALCDKCGHIYDVELVGFFEDKRYIRLEGRIKNG